MKQQRRSYILLFTLFLLFAVSAFAHPGNLDENGGHYNRKTGEYHYHSGENTQYNPSNSSDHIYPNDSKTETPSIKESHTFSFLTKLSADFKWQITDIIHLCFTFVCILLIAYFSYFKRMKDFPYLIVPRKISSWQIIIPFYLLWAILCSLSLNFSRSTSSIETLTNWFLIGVVRFITIAFLSSSAVLLPLYVLVIDHFFQKRLQKRTKLILDKLINNCKNFNHSNIKLVTALNYKVFLFNQKHPENPININVRLINELINAVNIKEQEKILEKIRCNIMYQIHSKKEKRNINLYFASLELLSERKFYLK